MERVELIDLLRATGCAEEYGGYVFLHDPKWGPAERTEVQRRKSSIVNRPSSTATGWLCIPTGGTSGAIRFARHDERTLTAAARGFAAHFGIQKTNAVDVLPPYHVSGLMARVRCAESGGRHVPWNWKRLEVGDVPELDAGEWVISLVPTQLQRLLASTEATAWLRRFAIVFIGGGPAWPELADAAAQAGLRLALSYGMTETAAMVAALRPDEFLAGARSCGAVMPHARIELDADGVIGVGGASLFRGYFPDDRTGELFQTADLGRIDERGHLHVLGRRDAVIITGGKKVAPAEVEAALRATGQFADVAVIGVPDAEWGEAVVACYPAGDPAPDLGVAQAALAASLPAFKRPKRYVPIANWPRNAQGKLNRAALAEQARRQRE